MFGRAFANNIPEFFNVIVQATVEYFTVFHNSIEHAQYRPNVNGKETTID